MCTQAAADTTDTKLFFLNYFMEATWRTCCTGIAQLVVAPQKKSSFTNQSLNSEELNAVIGCDSQFVVWFQVELLAITSVALPCNKFTPNLTRLFAGILRKVETLRQMNN